jgi:hypothetical protein
VACTRQICAKCADPNKIEAEERQMLTPEPEISARIVANLADMTLPKRFRLAFEDHIAIEWKFNRMTKR